MGTKKVTKMLEISMGKENPKELFNEIDPKFNVFEEKKKRFSYNVEEILDADDVIKGNSDVSTEDTRRASIRRRLIKKRVKYREKKKNAALLEELRMKEDGCPIPIEEKKNEIPEKQKEELSKRRIKAAARTLYGLTVASKE
jgi:hypothetical protein